MCEVEHTTVRREPLRVGPVCPKTELIFFSGDSESSYRMIAKLPIRPGSLWRAQSTVPFP